MPHTNCQQAWSGLIQGGDVDGMQPGLPEGAPRTSSQVGKASFKLAKALCEVVSVVFCDKMVLAYNRHTVSVKPRFKTSGPLRRCRERAHKGPLMKQHMAHMLY